MCFEFQGLVSGMDCVIGNIVDKLKETGFYDNTLILFSSDVSKQSQNFLRHLSVSENLQECKNYIPFGNLPYKKNQQFSISNVIEALGFQTRIAQ